MVTGFGLVNVTQLALGREVTVYNKYCIMLIDPVGQCLTEY